MRPSTAASGDRAPTLTAQRLSIARAEQRAGGGTVLDALLRHWEDEPTQLLSALEDLAGVGAIDDTQMAGAHLADLGAWTPEDARKWQCVVLKTPDQESVADGGMDAKAGSLLALCADPWDLALVRLVAKRFQRAARPLAATGSQMLRALLSLQMAGGEPGSERRIAPLHVTEAGALDAGDPVVSFVNSALARAISSNASDVHFECDRRGVSVKHRLDGVLQPFARLDDPVHAEAVIARIKVLAQLDITERRVPQDGRYRHGGPDGMDIRVSIMPSVHGEDAVLRLLDKSQFANRQAVGPQGRPSAAISLDALGFDDSTRALIRRLSRKPSGMLLVTGPTGSGKTTTLYAVLSEINNGLEKLITIEDPVEYELEGVLQIPVNERKGLTFSTGLRSILRHDPDRILVGEIRDADTAEIAVQASLTGHQVFTTVHANSVADIMGRFRHFGLDMFGFTSALNGIVVQRLVRRLCPRCSAPRDTSSEEIDTFRRQGHPVPARVHVPQGCAECFGAGYSGRFVIAEVHAVDDQLRELVTERAPLSSIKQHLGTRGVPSLFEVGLTHVAQGRTSIEELQRVADSL